MVFIVFPGSRLARRPWLRLCFRPHGGNRWAAIMVRLLRHGPLVRGICALLVVVIVSACGVATGTTPRAVEKHLIKVGIIPNVGAAPAFIASRSRFFADEGIDVQFVTIQSSETALPALENGDLDIVFGNYVSFFAEQVKGVNPIKLVADGYFAKPKTYMVVVAKGAKVRNIAELSGKRVAVTSSNGLAGLIVRSVLDTAGSTLAPPSFVEMAYPDMGTALRNHTVDGALLAEPYLTDVSMKTGAWRCIDAASGPTADSPVSGYATTDKIAARYPNTIDAFQRALSRGASVAGSDRAQVESVVHEFAQVDEQTAALMTLVGYP